MLINFCKSHHKNQLLEGEQIHELAAIIHRYWTLTGTLVSSYMFSHYMMQKMIIGLNNND